MFNECDQWASAQLLIAALTGKIGVEWVYHTLCFFISIVGYNLADVPFFATLLKFTYYRLQLLSCS